MKNEPFWKTNLKILQGYSDSNRDQNFWRVACYHYTIPLLLKRVERLYFHLKAVTKYAH